MLGEILDDLLISASTGRCITATRHFPARPPVLAPFPASLDPRIAAALRERGIEQLFSHQARVWDLVEAAKVMAKRRIRHLVVYEGGQLLGVLSVRDVLPAVLPE